MTPFLHNVADTFYQIYGQKISRFTFVFPNRRASIFFQHYLSQIAGKAMFSPEVLTITDLLEKLSPQKKADRIEMLFMLFDIYKRISGTSESFDEFLYWGEMLLNDFDDVDKYMVDAEQLFRNIADLKEIDAEFAYLSPTQLEAIRRFWNNFLPVGENDKKKDFLEMWKVLHELYTSLRKELIAKNMVYEGMMFRDVAERAGKDNSFELPFEKLIFVGLNGHSKSEEVFLKYLQKTGIADFYWDYTSPLVCDVDNKASFFIEKNRFLFPSQHALKEEVAPEKPTLEVIGIPSAVGQAKYTHNIIQNLVKEGQIVSSDQAMNTAVVLPDENLLLPTLYSIPESIDKVNVTMGYSLSNSSISGLMNQIFELQKNIRNWRGSKGFYFRPVLSILSHRYVTRIAPKESEELRKHIIMYNKVVVTEAELVSHPIFRKIFRAIEDWKAIPDYLQDILSSLNTLLFVSSKREEEDSNEELSTRTIDIETEFIVEYFKTINKMREVVKYTSPDMSVETYVKLLKKLVVNIAVPFTGEPLSGLQVMGVLETRALDFENLIVLSMNEGIFPMKKAANSFIPHNLRAGFELPTYEHQDSIFAYHFYRMIYRAKRIFLLYDTRTEGMQSGEVSRYYHQIKHLYSDHFHTSEKLAVYKVTTQEGVEISMQKTEQVMKKLQAFATGGSKSLSASSINTYIDCPLKFYLSSVEEIDVDEEDVDETIEASTFGTIFHYIMEVLYKPYVGRMLTSEELRKMSKNESLLTDAIEKSFAHNFFKIDTQRALTGQNYLTGEVLRKYTKKVLETDAKTAPFVYIQSEKRINIPYKLPSGIEVSLKSFIDRVDEISGRVRILDYKTGWGELKYRAMDELFDKEMKKRPKAVMQVFMYALLYNMEDSSKVIEPGIYFLRNLFDPKFDPNVIYRPERFDKRIDDFSMYRDEFKEGFDACLDEIFDKNVPFDQTPTGEACQWCSFANICKK